MIFNRNNIRPSNHLFSIFIIQIVIVLKLETTVSFRGVNKVLVNLREYFFINEIPTHTTIISYVKRMGVYNLTCQKEKADDWIIILDESVEFGNEKILVILGVREKDIDFNRALNYQDLQTLAIKISNRWSGEDIHREIQVLTKEIGTIKYAVADMGNAIKKALRISDLQHVTDITHKISWIIKELYHNDEQFISYTKKTAHLRGSLPLGKLAYLLPPAQRVNSRFMNLKPIVEWGNSIIRLLETKKELKLEREKFSFVPQYKEFLNEIHQIIILSIKIQKMIKNCGLSKSTLKQCKALFYGIRAKRIKKFKCQIMIYLEGLNAIATKVNSVKLLCSSDILESAFGKYKSYINANPSIGITDLCLTIAAFTSNFKNEAKIREAMESIKIKDLTKWRLENVGKSLLTRRLDALQKSRG